MIGFVKISRLASLAVSSLIVLSGPVISASTKCTHVYSPNEMLWPLGPDELPQAFSSAATSINAKKLPSAISALIQNSELIPASVNLDIGGGKYENVTKVLKKAGVVNLVYDPFNRTSAHNKLVVDQAQNHNANTVTVNNVLNVIKDRENWDLILYQAANALKKNGTLFIQIYEGDTRWNQLQREHFANLASRGHWNEMLIESQAGQTGSDSWQNNLPIEAYLPVVQKVFPNAAIESYSYVTPSGNSSSVKLIVAGKRL